MPCIHVIHCYFSACSVVWHSPSPSNKHFPPPGRAFLPTLEMTRMLSLWCYQMTLFVDSAAFYVLEAQKNSHILSSPTIFKLSRTLTFMINFTWLVSDNLIWHLIPPSMQTFRAVLSNDEDRKVAFPSLPLSYVLHLGYCHPTAPLPPFLIPSCPHPLL